MGPGQAFHLQAVACSQLGSSLYEALLERCARDHFEGGPVAEVVSRWDGNPVDDAVALRLMGGVHRLVLTGAAPLLAGHYPSVGGAPRLDAVGDAFVDTVAANIPTLRRAMAHPPQTNEVGRSAVLFGGLLEIDRLTELPLRLLEIGASAGLNLLVDRYRYELGVGAWGDPSSRTVVTAAWTGSIPDLERTPQVVERRGCDTAPLDVSDTDDRITLLSYVWADQLRRFRRLVHALATAVADPPEVDVASAAPWITAELTELAPGTTTVVMHSVVAQYLSRRERHRLMRSVREAGARATPDTPVAWLRMEPGRRSFELRLSLWPRQIEVVLATCHPHGTHADWFVGTDPH